jgi:serine protease AprX
MHNARRTATALPAPRRTATLLALALAATGLSALAPTGAGARAPLVDVVVTSTSAGVAGAAEAVRAAGGVVRDALPLAGGVSAQLPADAVLAPSFLVADNLPMSLASKKVASSKREATAVREALGLGLPQGEGAGVRIAVVDTGVAPSADFGSRLTHYDVSGSWEAGEAHDPYGHGTFVAGVAAGDGSASGGTYAGVAPGADVLDIRVADESGATDLITVLKGLEKAAELDADVVNLSMSSGSPLPFQLDPLTVALQRLWADGVVVVVPTGNDGPRAASVTSPGSDPTLLTVGALDEKLTADRSDDDVPQFSGRGPAPQGVSKPDLVAPGQSLVSLRSPGSTVDVENPSAQVDEAYFRGSGTSFATSAVAGAAATLLAERPALTPGQVKALVRGTTYDAKHLRAVNRAGTGGLDLAAALAAPAPEVVEEDAVHGPPPGDEAAWHAFLQALMDGDRAAAANSWSQLSPAAHKWAANSWSAHKWGAHKWGANSWSGRANSWSAHKWAGVEISAEEWESRFWAAHKWAAHKWATDSFVAHKWAAHKWAGSDWEAHKWAAHKWAAHKWAAHKWSASHWS